MAVASAQVRKGEKASPIVFYKVLDKPEASEDEAREGAGRIFAQGSHVFNIAKVEGYALAHCQRVQGTASYLKAYSRLASQAIYRRMG